MVADLNLLGSVGDLYCFCNTLSMLVKFALGSGRFVFRGFMCFTNITSLNTVFEIESLKML